MTSSVPDAATALASPVTADVAGVPTLTELFRTHHPFVWRMVRHLGIPPSSLDDATQEVFVIAGRKLPELTSLAQPRAWLFGIARGLAANWRRSSERRRAREDAWAQAEPSAQAQPDRELERRQAAASVETFLAELGEPFATTLVLVDVEGLSAPEVAEATGAALNTVYSRLRTARQRFDRFVESLDAGAS
ncbi:MAG: sigma-70 family RNA polymerase sigma factor [Deltaproteobacteria bacterium]|nr:sigma-70 family RNA polymerase sigma factor [Deltaproteobacteria bacterium]